MAAVWQTTWCLLAHRCLLLLSLYAASEPAPSLLSLPPEFMLPQFLSLFLDCCFGLSLYGASAPGPSLLSASAPAPPLLSLATQLQSGLSGDVVLRGFIGGSSWGDGSVEGRPLGQTTVGADCDGHRWTRVLRYQ